MLVMIALLAAGCGREDPVQSAIRSLGGPTAEARQAVMELRLISRDPVPDLIEAAQNPKTKPRTRLAAISVLGDIARRQDHQEALAFLHTLLSSDNPDIREAAVNAFRDTDYRPAVPDLIQLKRESPPELRKLIEIALRTTSEHMVRDIEKLWNSPEAALEAYEEAEAIGLDRGLVGYSKARFLEMRGRTQEANQQYDRLGMIRRWWLIGPFPNRQGMGFRQVYPPETEIDLKAEYPGTVDTITWYRMDRPLHAGLLDFESFFVETDNVVGYTLVYLVAEKETPIEVRAGSDDTLQLYLNHELVWAHEQYRAVKFDDDTVDLTIPPGTNTLVFKVCEDWGGWQLIGRITGPGDTPLEDVRVTLTP
jgi:hypothetical protein